ncbi:MAG: M20/M25/M40 family metallo-hydrolase [Bacteroidota bacterium]
MKIVRTSLLVFGLLVLASAARSQSVNDSVALRSIYTEVLSNSPSYEWLRDLCTSIGGRLSGSPEAERAVEWTRKRMLEAGADTVWLQEVWVPHWVRGAKESGEIIDKTGHRQKVPVCALGGSVATPSSGVEAEVIEVTNFDELEKLGKEKITGKIVFFNHPFDRRFVNTFNAYGEAGAYRWRGPSMAAKYGAVASIVRSMTLAQDDNPHTGSMRYADTLPQIPCCAISTNGADLLSGIIRADKQTRFSLKMNCATLDSVLSHNVIGEIRGSEHPEEFVVVGGHLDSWDTGDGAHDDGAGIVQSIDVLRTLKALDLRPRRSIRAVAFMNEENGTKGGKKYAEEAERKKEKHVAAIESDAGGFTPFGLGLQMDEQKKESVRKWQGLFKPYNVWNFEEEHGGADIGYLQDRIGTPLIGLVIESQRYFDVHHAPIDTIELVNKRELLLGGATMTSIAYLLATYGL